MTSRIGVWWRGSAGLLSVKGPLWWLHFGLWRSCWVWGRLSGDRYDLYGVGPLFLLVREHNRGRWVCMCCLVSWDGMGPCPNCGADS